MKEFSCNKNHVNDGVNKKRKRQALFQEYRRIALKFSVYIVVDKTSESAGRINSHHGT